MSLPTWLFESRKKDIKGPKNKLELSDVPREDDAHKRINPMIAHSSKCRVIGEAKRRNEMANVALPVTQKDRSSG